MALFQLTELAEVDVRTGLATPTGVSLSQGIYELAYHPLDGQWYGVRDAFGAVLVHVDLCTGLVTDIATLDDGGAPPPLTEGFTIDDAGQAWVTFSRQADTTSELLGELDLATGAIRNLSLIHI